MKIIVKPNVSVEFFPENVLEWEYTLSSFYARANRVEGEEVTRKHKPRKKHTFKKACGICGKEYKGLTGVKVHNLRIHDKKYWSRADKKVTAYDKVQSI